ncbi:putative cytochrome c [Pseudomonas aeruginosa]|nr:putative cytochrome c [Pseudomonas aeruginosa]
MPASFPRLGLLGALCSIVPLLHASEPTTDAALIEKGRYVAQLGDCIACHTGPQGAPMAGGLELKTPMGTIYSTNITPDRETGIGRYSFEEFDRAMRKGVTAEGVNLYPAMPYPSYAKISEEDMRALYAYLMHGVQPVTQANTPSAMSWPFNQRWGLSLWNWAFLDDAPFTPSSDADPVINRGAYLVQGLGHCGACHTPRGIAFQEKSHERSRSFRAVLPRRRNRRTMASPEPAQPVDGGGHRAVAEDRARTASPRCPAA